MKLIYLMLKLISNIVLGLVTVFIYRKFGVEWSLATALVFILIQLDSIHFDLLRADEDKKERSRKKWRNIWSTQRRI